MHYINLYDCKLCYHSCKSPLYICQKFDILLQVTKRDEGFELEPRKLASKLLAIGVSEVRLDEPLAMHSTWKIGGPSDILVHITDTTSLQKLVALAREDDIPLIVIGRGSNILFSDDGFRGIVAKFGKSFATARIDGQDIIADAGIWLPRLARLAASRGIAGLEHASGIPGTLGGLIYMNGGSLRQSIGDMTKRVWALDENCNVIEMSAEDCEFSYRSSVFQHRNLIILRAHLRGTPGDPRDIRKRILNVLAERKHKFPLKQPNCGSVFTNKPEVYEVAGPPGKIIEDAGLKGLRVGNVMVSTVHANFIVNLGGGTSKDVFELISKIRDVIYCRIGYWLECEVRYVTPNGDIAPLHKFL